MKISAYWMICLVILFTACKKEEVVNEAAFFLDNCRIISYRPTNQPLVYSFVYENDRILKGLTFEKNLQNFTFTTEFDHGQLSEINSSVDNEKSISSSTRFEYGSMGLQAIRYFSRNTSFYNIEHNIISDLEETGKYEFKYGITGQPVSMTGFTNSELGKDIAPVFKKTTVSTFEYDAKDNLTKEVFQIQDKDGNMTIVYTLEHSYDDKVNTLRQLNYLYFDVYTSAGYLFSKNNKIATRKIITEQRSGQESYKVIYDSMGRVVDDGVRFSAVKWNCE